MKEINSQCMHYEVWLIKENTQVYLTIAYGFNQPLERKSHLGGGITRLANANSTYDSPWLIMGEFNTIRNQHEKLGGAQWGNTYREDLNECCKEVELDDLRFMGSLYTWSNYSKGPRKIVCKLDRTFSNDKLREIFMHSSVTFLNPSILDYSPCIMNCGIINNRRKTRFKFFNMWTQHDKFLTIMKDSKKDDYEDNPMCNLIYKLKRLKREFNKLNQKEFGHISKRVLEARSCLKTVKKDSNFSP